MKAQARSSASGVRCFRRSDAQDSTGPRSTRTSSRSRTSPSLRTLTLLNHPTGYHGFELFNDDDATRDVIGQPLAFVRQATAPGYRTALRSGLQEAAAAGSVQTGNYREAARIYAELVRARPNARLALSYGESLLGDNQYVAACSLFATLKDKGLGPRDLGVPAARACAQAGEADGVWLRSIPSRFMPRTLVSDPAFASISSRPDFQAPFAGARRQ